jgi:hypothetical protein
MEFPYSVLCLNGGGIRGLLQIGALQFLEDHLQRPLHTVFPNGMYGISIGAVIISLLAFGFSTTEILDALRKTLNITDALSPVRLQQLVTVHQRKGLDDGKQFYASLSSIFSQRNLNLETLKIEQALCPLYIIASDITRMKPVIFAGHVRVWDAIRASTCIPLVFTPHILKNRVFVDGGCMLDGLMDFLPRKKKSVSLHIYCSREQGISKEQLLGWSLGLYSSFVMNSLYTYQHRQLQTEYPKSICVIPENEVQALDFKKASEQQGRLLEKGRSTMREFLSQALPSGTPSTFPGLVVQYTHTTSCSSPACTSDTHPHDTAHTDLCPPHN